MFFSLFAFLGGFFLGLLIAMYRFFKTGIIKIVLDKISFFVRGTPILFQTMLFLVLIPKLLGFNFPVIVAVSVLTINSSFYLSEIFLASFKGIPQIQYDLSKSLFFSENQTVKYILIPQVFMNTRNLLETELISLSKETAFLSFVNIGDIMFRTRDVISRTYDFILPVMFVGILYLLIGGLFKLIFPSLFNLCRKICNTYF